MEEPDGLWEGIAPPQQEGAPELGEELSHRRCLQLSSCCLRRGAPEVRGRISFVCGLGQNLVNSS